MYKRKPTVIERREESLQIRIEAAKIAYKSNDLPVIHQANGDETLPKKMMNYTKGLPHDYKTGLIVNEGDFDKFVDGICTGDPEVIKETPLGIRNSDQELKSKYKWYSDKGEQIDTVRAWESAGAGLTYDLQGPDAQAVTMKPAPKLGSDELTAEMAETYCQAILRDVPFTELEGNQQALNCLSSLRELSYFQEDGRNGRPLNMSNLFRGFTEGDLVGPYISQLLLTGNNGLHEKGGEIELLAKDGMINYGAITIDQRVRVAKDINYMTKWDEYIDVQNGADFRGLEGYVRKERRFISNGRDLATYVHYDALYEAYLNGCLLLLGMGTPFDKGVPFQNSDSIDKQQGFAHYGGPHILTLVTEVATRALKAVRYQKFNIHRRLRPEAFAARLHKKKEILAEIGYRGAGLEKCYDALEKSKIFDLLQGGVKYQNGNTGGNLLLPMAFCEGSPMHPSYGAGHATVAGACVTILKAFFNHNLYLHVSEDGSSVSFQADKPTVSRVLVPSSDGSSLLVKTIEEPLTLEGELNKLAANISIGRNWAGVHYYSDYKDSLIMGEEVAIGMLQEQAITYNPAENFFLTLRKFDGTEIKIANEVAHTA